MPTSEQLKQWEREHEEANKTYRDRVKKYLLELTSRLTPELLVANNQRQHFLTEVLEIDGQVICVTSPISFKNNDLNKFIINKNEESGLYREILANADRFISERLDNFDTGWFELLDGLAKNIDKSLSDREILYKRFNYEERGASRSPVYFNKENAKEFFVCLHYATLQNAIIEDLIQKYDLPIKVFSLFNYFTNHEFQNPHRIILITDLEGNIIAIMEQDFVARPSEPKIITQLFTPGHDGHRVIYRLGADGLPDAGYYLLHDTFFTDDPQVTTSYQLRPDGEKIQIEELKERLREARERYAQQQGQPSPSVKPEPSKPNQPYK
jgi:hypothetical protein